MSQAWLFSQPGVCCTVPVTMQGALKSQGNEEYTPTASLLTRNDAMQRLYIGACIVASYFTGGTLLHRSLHRCCIVHRNSYRTGV
jgi:hypothetical protein